MLSMVEGVACAGSSSEKAQSESDHWQWLERRAKKEEVVRDDTGLLNLGPLTGGLIFHAKNFGLSTGNEKPSEAFKEGSGMIWSYSRELTPTEQNELTQETGGRKSGPALLKSN